MIIIRVSRVRAKCTTNQALYCGLTSDECKFFKKLALFPFVIPFIQQLSLWFLALFTKLYDQSGLRCLVHTNLGAKELRRKGFWLTTDMKPIYFINRFRDLQRNLI